MVNEDKKPTFSVKEMSEALEICKHSSETALTASGLNPGYLFWRSQRWLDVEEHFGESKSEVLLAALEAIAGDFHSLANAFLADMKQKGDMRAAFDCREAIVKKFEKKYPTVPSKVLRCLEMDFAHEHR